MSVKEKVNSFGDVDYTCKQCGTPVVREETTCPSCGDDLHWWLFRLTHPFHKGHA